MVPNSRVFAAAVLAVSGLTLAACGGHSATTAQVPTLPTAGSATRPTSSAAASNPDPGQPRERLDMTNAELNALFTQYNQCLAANGFDKSDIRRKHHPPDKATMERAETACRSKQPLPPWELDANNPHGADFVHAVVQCLRAKGVRYVDEEPPEGGRYIFGFGGANNDQESISKGLQYTPDCEKQVAAQGIGH